MTTHPMERSRFLRAMGANLWSAFLWAGVATTLFFATFDPEVIALNATYPASLSSEAGYTLGFLLFWILLTLHGACVQYLGLSNNHPNNSQANNDSINNNSVKKGER